MTLGETSHQLEQPFLVLATQNPIEHEGTYPLPEAQVDRFMLKLVVNYPERDDECEIVKRIAVQEVVETTKPVLSAAAIAEFARLCRAFTSTNASNVMWSIWCARSRPGAGTDSQAQHLRLGASPRAAIFLTRAARFQAFLEGRSYVLPDDVQSVANDVLSHRFVLTYEAEADDVTPESILQNILDRLPVP